MLKKLFRLFHRSLFAIFLAIGILVAAQGSVAKELASRLGVGYRNAYPFDLPSIAASYYPNADYGIIGAIGIDTKKDESKSAFTAGVRRIIFKEEQMNFFMGGALSMLSEEVAAETSSGYEVNALVGGEFFLHGLDSLGINFETGIGVTSLKKVRFRTLGNNFVNAGVFFYF